MALNLGLRLLGNIDLPLLDVEPCYTLNRLEEEFQFNLLIEPLLSESPIYFLGGQGSTFCLVGDSNDACEDQ